MNSFSNDFSTVSSAILFECLESMLEDQRLQLGSYLHPCPRCGKQAMKEIEQNHFYCFWCHFDGRVNNLDFSGNPGAALGLGMVFFILLIFLL